MSPQASDRASRRVFLKGGITAAVVLGFDPVGRTWVTEASAQSIAGLPPLDGVLLTDASSLQAAADDFGHIVHRQPIAVLQPGSVNDIVVMVNYARQHGLKIAARGQRHTTFGQSQVGAGIVVDMASLNTPTVVAADRVQAGAGTLWASLLKATLAEGLKPPVLTNYLDLSVGGTLSVGGLGGESFRVGAQVDNVLELQVVTGAGQLVTCSATQNGDLFQSVLAGLGQCAIIVQATVRLVPAPKSARLFFLQYADLPTMLADQRLLIADGRFDSVIGLAQYNPKAPGGWVFYIQAAKYFTSATPVDAALLAGLHFFQPLRPAMNLPYFYFADQARTLIQGLQASGRYGLPHPWIDLLVPGSAIDAFATGVFSTLTIADVSPDFPIQFYALRTSTFTRPLFRVPDEDIAFLFSVDRTAPNATVAGQMVAANYLLYQAAAALGSKFYPIGAVPLTQHDWQQQYHPFWGQLVSSKRHFDPDNVLTPGPGIF